MELFKSSRFWISIAIVISVTLLACLGKIAGDNAISAIMGLLAGFGVGKSGGAKKAETKAPASPVVGVLLLVGVIGLASCTSLQKTISTTSSSIKTVSDIALPIYHRACMLEAEKCLAKNIKSSECEGWKKCDSSRSLFHKIIDGAHVACISAYAISSTNEVEAKKLLSTATGQIAEAYKLLKDNEVIK